MKILTDTDLLMEVLLHIPLFADFRKDEIETIFGFSKCEIREYYKDEIIHLQNERCQFVEIILDGKVTVQNIDENGNILVIDNFGVGDIIGANLMFSSKNVYPMTVIASMRTIIITIRKEIILDLCHRSLLFLIGLLGEISDKTIILTEKINAISRKSIRQCILEFLKQEQIRQGRKVIDLPLSKKELAERLGIARSSLGRELIKMRKNGMLEYDARTITIKIDL